MAIFAADLAVRHCDKLESIVLRVILRIDNFDSEDEDEEGEEKPSRGITWVSDILDQLSSSSLRTIRLDLSDKPVDDVHLLNLAPIDNILAQPHFTHVEVILIPPRTDGMSEEAERRAILQEVLRFLPNLCAKQGVKFAWEAWDERFPLMAFPGLQASLRGLEVLD